MSGTAKSITTSLTVLGSVQRMILEIDWTDDTNGTAMPVNIGTLGLTGWYLVQAKTIPGSPAPTNGYNITLPTIDNEDLALGLLASRSSSSVQRVAISSSNVTYPMMIDNFVFALAGNSVNGAKGIIKLIFSAN